MLMKKVTAASRQLLESPSERQKPLYEILRRTYYAAEEEEEEEEAAAATRTAGLIDPRLPPTRSGQSSSPRTPSGRALVKH